MDRHLPQLDGLRGIAILIVVFGHLLVFSFGFGITKLGPLPPVGVDLFFVLSGFLITGILLRTKSDCYYFRNFYARRGLRVLPLYYLFLIFTFAFAARHVAALGFNPSKQHWQVYALYLQNIFYKQSTDLGPLHIVITWSLCVEEQFYLIWPALVLLLSPRKLTWFLVAVIVAAPISRVVLPHYGWDPYINPLSRFDAIAMGSLLAMWIYFRMPDARRIARTAWLIVVAAALGEVAFHAAHLTRITSKSMVAAAFTALIALALSVPRLSRVLSFSPLVITGRISYCMYLCHVIVAKMVLAWLPQSPALLRVSLILALTYAVALCSWHLLEAPILTMKRYFQADRPEERPVGHSLPAVQFEESGGG